MKNNVIRITENYKSLIKHGQYFQTTTQKWPYSDFEEKRYMLFVMEYNMIRIASMISYHGFC